MKHTQEIKINMAEETPLDKLPVLSLTGLYREQLCLKLEATKLFHGFSRGELEVLLDHVRARLVPKGSMLYVEGNIGSYLCVIVSGRVSITKKTTGDEIKKISTVREGATLGEMSLVDNFPHSATAETLSECEVLYLNRERLIGMSGDFPQLTNHLLWSLASQISARLRQTSGLLVDYL